VLLALILVVVAVAVEVNEATEVRRVREEGS
jgi:hypothetical protein